VPPLQTTMLSAHNSDNTLTATLQAFERYGVSRILAEPTVSAVSGESAKLTVGGEIPIPGPSICAQNSGCTGGGAIFQPYGVTLRFSPVVLSEGRILLHLATEVTEIDDQTGQTVFGTSCPDCSPGRTRRRSKSPQAARSLLPAFSRRYHGKPLTVFRDSSTCRFSARCFAPAITSGKRPSL
jgi:pilus assembly protein CpaC